jgi:hypothetical protein
MIKIFIRNNKFSMLIRKNLQGILFLEGFEIFLVLLFLRVFLNSDSSEILLISLLYSTDHDKIPREE